MTIKPGDILNMKGGKRKVLRILRDSEPIYSTYGGETVYFPGDTIYLLSKINYFDSYGCTYTLADIKVELVEEKNEEEFEFVECVSCASKPGTPVLCAGCLHNRSVIAKLIQIKKAIKNV